MYLEYMKNNFKKNLLIQIRCIIAFFFFLGIGEQFSIQFLFGLIIFLFVLSFMLFLGKDFSGYVFNFFLYFMDFMYVVALFMVFDLSIRCGGLIMVFLIRNTYVFCCKKFNISGVMKKKEEDDDSGNDNEQISSN